jgi:hypothetical protein
MGIGFDELIPQYAGPQLMPMPNSQFSILRFEKATFVLYH